MISFLQGLQSVEESLSCPLWRQRLAQARALIVQGEPIWQALSRCGGFTPLCLQLIRTGESAGALDQMLENLAHHHRQQTYQRADSLAAHLEPMMLVITKLAGRDSGGGNVFARFSPGRCHWRGGRMRNTGAAQAPVQPITGY